MGALVPALLEFVGIYGLEKTPNFSIHITEL